MRKCILGAAALPLAALLHVTTAPSAHACCDGQRPPTPAQLQFIADAHRVGMPGVDATEYTSSEGYPVEIGNWPGLNVRDSNILYAGIAICTTFEVSPSNLNSDQLWSRKGGIYFLLGSPVASNGYRPGINEVVQYARADLAC
jgi:hypothetical protein